MYDVKETDFFDLEEESFDTVIGADIQFSGSVRFVKPFMIKGRVDGAISATSDLVVDAGATVNADIQAKRVLIKGTVTGNITADTLVFITQSGTLTGDITAGQVVLEPGSTFSGRCIMVKTDA
ncbi:MAG: polymer-forming cytoskeletal protein [Treponema sp.]|nr:polymer-forming cytoskeletal protein [Treponema sp.]